MRTGSRLLVGVIVAAGVAVTAAQTDRGEAATVVQRSAPIELSRMRFLTFAFGREGPMDVPLRIAPVSGREYFVEADVSGIEAVVTIRFELVDASGRALRTVTMWKATDGGTDGEFYGVVVVPAQPFRAIVTGTTTRGGTFRAANRTLVQPAASGPMEQGPAPPGLSSDQARQLDRAIADHRDEMTRRAAQAAAAHPNGIITMARPIVSAIAYEPLGSSTGAPIGLRLRYSIRFPTRQVITAVPHVFPAYQPTAWRGVVSMSALTGSVTPAPELAGVQSVQDLIRYRASATYQAGVTYTFTIDMVPDYVIQGQSGRFCVDVQRFAGRQGWNALIASEAPVAYSVSIADTDTAATIPSFFSQRTFYESALEAGATDCGRSPAPRL